MEFSVYNIYLKFVKKLCYLGVIRIFVLRNALRGGAALAFCWKELRSGEVVMKYVK